MIFFSPLLTNQADVSLCAIQFRSSILKPSFTFMEDFYKARNTFTFTIKNDSYALLSTEIVPLRT